jgi:hypothetical protein
MSCHPNRARALVRPFVAACAIAAGVSHGLVAAQQPGQPPQERGPNFGPLPAPSPAERVGRDLVRIGTILVDTAKKEFSISGFVNEVQFLEFLANTKGGWKAYESAIELDTNAVNFNVACLLIGLDNTGAVAPRFQFDPEPPQGHPVDLFVEWDEGGKPRRVRAEQLVYNRVTKQTLAEGPWVYTGSVFRQANQYLAEVEGVLVGFMHTPASVIDSARRIVGVWGDSGINPELNLKPGMQVKLIVQALRRPAR